MQGLSLDLARVTCFPRCGNLSEKTKRPAIAHCSGTLTDAVARSSVVLAMGPEAIQGLLGEGSPPSQVVGSVLGLPTEIQPGEITVLGPEKFKSGKRKGQLKPRKQRVTVTFPPNKVIVATHSPSELRQKGFIHFDDMMADLRRTRKVLKGEMSPHCPLASQTVRVTDGRTLVSILPDRPVAVDVETDRETSELEMVGVAPDIHQVYIMTPDNDVLNAMSQVVDSHLLIMHNAKFDLSVLYRYGVFDDFRTPYIWDTMQVAHFLDGHLDKKARPLNLAAVARRTQRYPFFNWKAVFKRGSMALDQYNALDCAWTYAIYEEQRERLAPYRKATEHLTNAVHPALKAIIKMELEGVRVDLKRQRALLETQMRVLRRLHQEWKEQFPSVNIDSPKQLIELLYSKLNLPVIKKDDGSPSVDRETLEKLLMREDCEEHRPLLRHILSYRHVRKMATTYLNPSLIGDRIYPRYNLAGTRSGRLSGGGEGGFNFQNIPRYSRRCRRGVEGCQCGLIRSIFIGDTDDERIVAADWSQIEFRLAGLIFQDSKLMKQYEDPSFDIHQEVANALGCSRNHAKIVVYGLSYGMGERTLAQNLGVSVKQARAYRDGFIRLYPEMARTKQYYLEQAKNNGVVLNPFGRRFVFRQVEMPKVIASLPQSTAGDMMLRVLARCLEMGLKLRFTVHDEVGISASTEEEMQVLKEIMEEPVPQLDGWHCPVSIGIARHWGDAKS